MKFNETMLGRWQKYMLDNGNILYLRERKKDITNDKEIKRQDYIKPKVNIKIRSISKEAIGTTTIILTDSNNNFLGLCEFKIRDGEAGLASRDSNEYNCMDLPEELEKERDEIQSNDNALFVNKKMKYCGIGTQLLIIGFNYLIMHGIDNVDVASCLSARDFYQKTGANFNSKTDISYTNLPQVVDYLSKKTQSKTIQELSKKR